LVAELSLRIPGGPGAPAEARDALRRLHPELTAEVMQVVSLLASELVSNSVRHASADWVELRCGTSDGHVRVEVSDGGEGFGENPVPRDPGRDGGWGLFIVDELASRWGVVEGSGTRVWFEIDR
jgi:anti-sigma regulatory factor (Ser/Thr protein kinase)